MSDFINPEEPEWDVTQPFGSSPGGYNPAGGHTGRDKNTPIGRPLRAPADGTITLAGNAGPWNTNDYWLEGSFAGQSVALDTGPYAFTFNHLSEVLVSVGQTVRQGDIIAISGNSGGATSGPHHHFECMPDGWNFQNGTYGRINPDTVVKGFWSGGAQVASAPNQRVNGPQITNQRADADISSALVREIPAGQLEVWEGFVHGQKVTIGGFTSDVWFKDKIGYAWCGGFESQSTDGLPDLTPRASLAANQRLAGSAAVNQRKSADVNAEIVRVIPPTSVEVFIGFVHGQNVTVGSLTSDIWYVDAKGYAWSGGFESQSTVGLPDLTVPPTPVVTPPTPPVIKPPATAYLNGIDVSDYQESAALQTIRTDFYGIKASEGVGWEDPALASNVAEARLSGKPIIFYHYARPLATAENTSVAEAVWFLQRIKPFLQLGDLVALDWEAENLNRSDWALEFLQRVQLATGALPFIYMNAEGVNAADWSRVELTYPLWYSGGKQYDTLQNGYAAPEAAAAQVSWISGMLMWQYSQKGRLTNYAGDLDLNVFYGSAGALTTLGATKTLQDPAPNPPIVTPPAPSTDEAVLTRFFKWLIDLFLKSGK